MDPKNAYDKYAVKVLYMGYQIGWVPRTLSEKVTGLIKTRGLKTSCILSHDRSRDLYDVRLVLELTFGALSRLVLPNIDIPNCNNCSSEGLNEFRNAVGGRVFGLRSNGSRTSVTVTRVHLNGDAKDLMWFSKDGIDLRVVDLINDGKCAAKYAGNGRLQLAYLDELGVSQQGRLGVLNMPPAQVAAGDLMELTPEQKAIIAAGRHLDLSKLEARVIDHAKDALGYAVGGLLPNPLYKNTATTGTATTQPPKEITMSKIDSILASNKTAATVAATMEAGRIANNQVAKLAAKQLPMVVRGYADTPMGKLVIANMAQQAAKHFRPEDTTIAALTDAMAVQAYQELIQVMDIEGFLDNLMDSKEIKRAVAKLDSAKKA
jgi:hypothetical protein